MGSYGNIFINRTFGNYSYKLIFYVTLFCFVLLTKKSELLQQCIFCFLRSTAQKLSTSLRKSRSKGWVSSIGYNVHILYTVLVQYFYLYHWLYLKSFSNWIFTTTQRWQYHPWGSTKTYQSFRPCQPTSLIHLLCDIRWRPETLNSVWPSWLSIL